MDVTADLAQPDIPWQHTGITAYTRDGRKILEGVMKGVEPGDGERGVTSDVTLVVTKPSD